MLAGLSGGVWSSTNGGTTWRPASSGLTSGTVLGVAISGGTAYAGAYGAGVFRSTDLGASWQPRNSSLGNINVHEVVLAGGTVYACTEDGVFASTDEMVHHGRSGIRD